MNNHLTNEEMENLLNKYFKETEDGESIMISTEISKLSKKIGARNLNHLIDFAFIKYCKK
jgi:hypothetical protein